MVEIGIRLKFQTRDGENGTQLRGDVTAEMDIPEAVRKRIPKDFIVDSGDLSSEEHYAVILATMAMKTIRELFDSIGPHVLALAQVCCEAAESPNTDRPPVQ
jgi:ribosomal protein S12 methylthiotransferase accessory factor YcaO